MIKDTAICAGLILLLQFITPEWQWIMVVPLIFMAMTGKSGFYGFLIGGLSAGIVWEGYAWFIYFTSGDIIAGRVAAMVGIGPDWLLVIITGLTALIAGGVAGMTGSLLRALLKPAGVGNSHSGTKRA